MIKLYSHLTTLTLILVLTLGFANAAAQDVYFTSEQMPNMLNVMPGPPDTLSARYAYDVEQYQWGKTMRDTPRGQIAITDAVYGMQTIINEFSGPFGLQISKNETPEIYKLLNDALATTANVTSIPKNHYMRKRPYMVFNEPTSVPEDEEELSHNGSYPSGHTVLGWSAALLLMEINPEAQDALLKRGFEYGQSRVIAGFHWQSDVDAARVAASTAYARLHTSDAFLKQMKKARKEFKKKVKSH